jgi:hypothetical protein
VHRKTKDADIYFVANQADSPVHLDARFRVAGKAAQIWRPMSGDIGVAIGGVPTVAHLDDRSGNRQPGIEPAAYISQPGFTTLPLDLAERESVFVVFPNEAATSSGTNPAVSETKLATVAGPWELSFPAGLGAPPNLSLEKLASWTENADPGVKYFSGTATYTKTVEADAAWFKPGARIYLDLGKVRDLADVQVNGKPVGLVWAPPYRLDVTGALKPGTNRLEINVTNEWTNRLIGDRLLPVEKRILAQPGVPAPPGGGLGGPQILGESGLLGEVTLVEAR